MIPPEADAAAVALLERFGFDAERFAALRERVAAGALSPAANVVEGAVEPPDEAELTVLPEPGGPGWAEAREAGLSALGRGEIGVVVLSGGMATRFGGVVKGIVEAVGGRTFLELKLAEVERLGRALGVEIPVALMTSFATDAPTRQFLSERSLEGPLLFSQSVSLRLRPGGELFLDERRRVSLYAPGHGDLFEALRRSGVLRRLRERGVRHVLVSNVDNLGARLDPVVLGAHLLAGRPLTVEVARREGDPGGAPVRVGGRLRLLEGPGFPPGFDHSRLPVFNTNTSTFAIEVLEEHYELSWLYVEKSVEGRVAVQLERLYHEVTATLPTTYLVVPRTGPRGRFVPIKEPADLARSREVLRELLGASPLD